MKQVAIVTVSTAPQHAYQKIQKQTAKRLGYQYTSIGQGVEWEGFVTKMKLPIQYLENQLSSFETDPENNPDPKETLYVFVDAYDLVFVGPPDEILKKYKDYQSPIVVGSEQHCFANCQPLKCDDVLSSEGRQGRRFINTGCVLGDVDALLKYYKWGVDNYPADDQVAMARYKNLHCDVVTLDMDARIVFNYPFNIYASDKLEPVENQRFQIRNSDVQPCLVHCPFIFQDLGKRWDMVLSHILPEYAPTQSKGQLFHQLVKKLYKDF